MVFGSKNDRTAIIYPRVSGALRCANTPYGGRTIALLLFTQELVVRYAALTHPTVVERSHCYHLPKS
ncbi:hypothetical protein [Floridanema aerugineum]|uniref:Uncharacterized protein n=1 Tax=Floridaenema aerugineum BLCC-F46 TaxID=3153654 RepID=A0ABV4WZM8_9CYAN